MLAERKVINMFQSNLLKIKANKYRQVVLFIPD